MIDYTKGRKDVSYLQRTYELKRIEKTEDVTNKLDIDAINERLGEGDLDVLEELEKLQITYQLEENDNGYKVKYSYEGTNYTVVYYGKTASSDKYTNADNLNKLGDYLDIYGTITLESAVPEVPVTLPDDETTPEPVTPPTDEPVEVPEEESYTFDYKSAGVDKDARIEDFLSEDTLNTQSLLVAHDVRGGEAEADVDTLLAELDKMRPQLLEYIKTSLEEQNKEFDSAIAEKVIDMALTVAVENGIQVWVQKNSSSYKDFLMMNSVLGEKVSQGQSESEFVLKIEDLVNNIKQLIEQVYSNSNGDYSNFATAIQSVGNEKANGDGTDIKLNSLMPIIRDVDDFMYTDKYLLYTDDYFLTPEEQKLKDCMQDAENESGMTFDLNDLYEKIDVYAQHIKRVLYSKYKAVLTESEIDSLVSKAADEVKNAPVQDQEIGGKERIIYMVGETLVKFEELCEKYADEAWRS